MTRPNSMLDLYCPESDYKHSEIRLENPRWPKCLYCNTRFPEKEEASLQVPKATATGHSTLQPARTPDGVRFSAPTQPDVPPHDSRPLTGAAFEPAVLPLDRQLGYSPAAQSTTSTSSALPTHVAQQHRPTLNRATGVGLQRKNDSLANLQRDKEALSRKPDNHDRKMLVSLHFFIAVYRHEKVGSRAVKTFAKIHDVGRTEALNVVVGQPYASQQALIKGLLAAFWVSPEINDCVDVDQLQICTTLDAGTTTRPPRWHKLPVDPKQPLSLVDYKSQVHDAEGRENDTRRSAFIQKSKNPRSRVLGVFLVHEEPEEGVLEDDRPSPAFETAVPAFRRSPKKAPASGGTKKAPASGGTKKAPASKGTKPLASPQINRPVSPEDDTDDDCLFVRQVSTPGSRSLSAGFGQELASFDTPPLARATPTGTARLMTASSTGTPSRPVRSSIAPPSTARQRPAQSANSSTSARRSPAASSVDFPALAPSTPTLADSVANGSSLIELGGEEHNIGGSRAPIELSPNPWQFDDNFDNSDDGPEEFVRPADLQIKACHAQDNGQTKEAGGVGPVEEEMQGDIVVELAGKKRKRAKPGSVKPNGAPKYKTRASKQAKTGPSTAQGENQELVATRHSGRIQARGTGPSAR